MWYVIMKLVVNCKDNIYLIKVVNFQAVVLFIRIWTCFISHRTFGNIIFLTESLHFLNWKVSKCKWISLVKLTSALTTLISQDRKIFSPWKGLQGIKRKPVAQTCSGKKVFLEILQNSQEKFLRTVFLTEHLRWLLLSRRQCTRTAQKVLLLFRYLWLQ